MTFDQFLRKLDNLPAIGIPVCTQSFTGFTPSGPIYFSLHSDNATIQVLVDLCLHESVSLGPVRRELLFGRRLVFLRPGLSPPAVVSSRGSGRLLSGGEWDGLHEKTF